MTMEAFLQQQQQAKSDSLPNSSNRAVVRKLTDPQEIYSALPFRVAQSSAVVQGKTTNVLTQHFVDRILVIVTQLGKIGDLTQITTQKRPTLPNILDDDLLNDDFDAGRASRQRQRQTTERDDERQEAQEEDDISAIDSTTTTSLALFGTVPAGQETLYDFYRQQISALIQKDLGALGDIRSEDGLDSKPVIVGLSLSLPTSAAATGEVQNEEGDDFSSSADAERTRYQAILRLVKEARTW